MVSQRKMSIKRAKSVDSMRQPTKSNQPSLQRSASLGNLQSSAAGQEALQQTELDKAGKKKQRKRPDVERSQSVDSGTSGRQSTQSSLQRSASLGNLQPLREAGEEALKQTEPDKEGKRKQRRYTSVDSALTVREPSQPSLQRSASTGSNRQPMASRENQQSITSPPPDLEPVEAGQELPNEAGDETVRTAGGTSDAPGELETEARRRAEEIAQQRIDKSTDQLRQTAEDEKKEYKNNLETQKNNLLDTSKNGSSKEKRQAKKQLKEVEKKEKNLPLKAKEIDQRVEADIQNEKNKLEDYKQEEYEKFRKFLQDTDNDNFSFSALDLTDSVEDAKELLKWLREQPNLKKLATQKDYQLLKKFVYKLVDLDKVELTNALELISTLLNRTNPETLRKFNTMKNDGLTFLKELHETQGLETQKIIDVGDKIKKIEPFIQDTDSKQKFAQLLAKNNLNDIIKIIEQLKKPVYIERFNDNELIDQLNKFDLSVDTASPLSSALEWANKLYWKKDFLEKNLEKISNLLSKRDSSENLHDVVMRELEKEKDFQTWIDTINLLVKEGGYKLINKEPTLLPGDKDNPTYEVVTNINDSNNRPTGISFVMHYHPNASKSDINNPNASKRHLKPDKHSKTNRIYEEKIPESLKNSLPSVQQIKDKISNANKRQKGKKKNRK